MVELHLDNSDFIKLFLNVICHMKHLQMKFILYIQLQYHGRVIFFELNGQD